MNSRTFLVHGGKKYAYHREDMSMREVNFINFGLMKGLVRSEGGEKEVKNGEMRQLASSVPRMGWCHRELLRGFDVYYSELDYLFRRYHNKYLMADLLRGIPYYIPYWLGGLGLDPGPNPGSQITWIQRQQAKIIYKEIEKPKMRPVSVCLSKTCLIDDLITKATTEWCKEFDVPYNIPNFQKLELEDGYSMLDLEKSNRDVYGDLVEYIWRTRPLDQFFSELDDNFVEVSNKLARNKILKNGDIWRNAFDRVIKENSSPLQWYKTWHQKQKKVLAIVPFDAVRESLLERSQLLA